MVNSMYPVLPHGIDLTLDQCVDGMKIDEACQTQLQGDAIPGLHLAAARVCTTDSLTFRPASIMVFILHL